MSEKGKYRVNVKNVVDISELSCILGDFKWFGWDVDYECLYINIADKEVSRGVEGFRGDIFGDYCSVTYEEMLEILSTPSYGLTPEKAEMISLNTQKAYTEKYSNGDSIGDIMNFDVNRELKIFKENYYKETLKQNLDILNDHLLNGTRIQFNCSGDQWHNVTGKFKLEQLNNKSIKFRVRPDRVNIDGYMLTPKQAIDYINRNYDNE